MCRFHTSLNTLRANRLVCFAPVQPLALLAAVVDEPTAGAVRKGLAGAIPHAALGAPALDDLAVEHVCADGAAGLWPSCPAPVD